MIIIMVMIMIMMMMTTIIIQVVVIIRDLSEISRGGWGAGGRNFKFGFGNEVTHPCNESEIC